MIAAPNSPLAQMSAYNRRPRTAIDFKSPIGYRPTPRPTPSSTPISLEKKMAGLVKELVLQSTDFKYSDYEGATWIPLWMVQFYTYRLNAVCFLTETKPEPTVSPDGLPLFNSCQNPLRDQDGKILRDDCYILPMLRWYHSMMQYCIVEDQSLLDFLKRHFASEDSYALDYQHFLDCRVNCLDYEEDKEYLTEEQYNYDPEVVPKLLETSEQRLTVLAAFIKALHFNENFRRL